MWSLVACIKIQSLIVQHICTKVHHNVTQVQQKAAVIPLLLNGRALRNQAGSQPMIPSLCCTPLHTQVTQSLMGKDLASASAGMDSYVLLRLKADVQSQLNTLKNTAYTMGYGAGKGADVSYAQKQFAHLSLSLPQL